MLKKLSSPWAGSIIGLISYLAVTAITWNAATAHLVTAEESRATGTNVVELNPFSAAMSSVEIEALVKELRDERESVSKREKELTEWAARLNAERTELNQLTNTVYRLQKEFDASVSRVSEEETANLKKIAKTYTSMEPEGAAGIFKQMEDTAVVKIMVFMKESETGPILAALSRGGEADAKRAADLTEKLRLAVVPKKK